MEQSTVQPFIQPVVRTAPARKLAGLHLPMSLAANRTPEVWRSFIPRRKEITDAAGPELFSVTVYHEPMQPETFSPHVTFEKWAAAEVTGNAALPHGMDSLELPEGLYAVFTYKGHPAAFAPVFRYFFETWLPASGYEVDDRPHYEIMGEKYRNDDPSSEEDVYIPVKPRSK